MNRRTLAVLAAAAMAALPTVHRNYALAQAPADVVRFTVAPTGNEARYRVREQLARLNFPNDAVGKTTGIQGGIAVDQSGAIVESESRFTIDVASLASDSDRRDNFVRRNTLQTAEHPNVVFVPTGFRNLKFPLPENGELTFQIVGNLTIRGVTQPVTWDVTAKAANGSITGDATTQFTFDEFQITKPRVASVLSVADEIKLEYTFNLVRQQ